MYFGLVDRKPILHSQLYILVCGCRMGFLGNKLTKKCSMLFDLISFKLFSFQQLIRLKNGLCMAVKIYGDLFNFKYYHILLACIVMKLVVL